jgi:hypothetical protein
MGKHYFREEMARIHEVCPPPLLPPSPHLHPRCFLAFLHIYYDHTYTPYPAASYHHYVQFFCYHIRSSNMKGELPGCLLELRNMSQLLVAGNGLIGTLPNEDLSMSIKRLDIGSNRFQGTIPDWDMSYIETIGKNLLLYRLLSLSTSPYCT